MSPDGFLHHFRWVCLPRVVKSQRFESANQRIVGFAGIVELSKNFVKLAHVHVDECAIVARDDVLPDPNEQVDRNFEVRGHIRRRVDAM